MQMYEIPPFYLAPCMQVRLNPVILNLFWVFWSFVENNMQGDLNEERSLWTPDSLDLRNNVQGGGSKRNRSTNNAKLPRKRMRPSVTDPTECSNVPVEDRRTHADAGPPAKKSRYGVNATNTSNCIGIRVETKKRKASGDDKVPKKKMKWSKESSSSGSCVEMLSAESSDGMELSISSENRGGGNFSSDSSSMNTSRGKPIQNDEHYFLI